MTPTPRTTDPALADAIADAQVRCNRAAWEATALANAHWSDVHGGDPTHPAYVLQFPPGPPEDWERPTTAPTPPEHDPEQAIADWLQRFVLWVIVGAVLATLFWPVSQQILP